MHRRSIQWLITRLPSALLGALLGALLSIPISYHFWTRQPPSLEEIEARAFVRLHDRDFEESVAEFSKALSVDPSSSHLWEGKAYAHLGIAYPETFNLNGVWQNFELEPKPLSGELMTALACARKAHERALSAQEQIRANLILGLVLELTGLDDYGASRYGLSPLSYYAAAAKRLADTDLQSNSLGSPSAIKFTPYREVIDYAIEHRLRTRYNDTERASMLDYHFSTHPELVQQYSMALSRPVEDRSSQ